MKKRRVPCHIQLFQCTHACGIGSCIAGEFYLTVKIEKEFDNRKAALFSVILDEIIPIKSKHLRNDGCLTKDKSDVPSECQNK